MLCKHEEETIEAVSAIPGKTELKRYNVTNDILKWKIFQ